MSCFNVSAGVFFYSKNTNRFLYLLRNDSKNYCWGIPGGKIEDTETLFDGLERECIEELEYWPANAKLVPLQKFENHNFIYHTFFCEIQDEFIPKLNEEHLGYAWVNLGNFPKPLHPGLFNMINFDVVQKKVNYLVKQGE
jgi:8-oxo-dGTP pyrophosphatase MutT (NUDIX family)